MLLWTVVLVFLAGLALSQLVLPWKLSEGGFVLAEIRRSQGFYSHPLTLAYVAAVFLPAGLYAITSKSKKNSSRLNTLAAVSLLAVAVLSQSRTVVLLAACLFGWLMLFKTQGRLRLHSLAGLLTFVLLALLVFKGTKVQSQLSLLERPGDRSSLEYSDDRLAFWQAHLSLWKNRPITGYGYLISEETRSLAYEAIGLSHFKKKYNAHNQWLEWLVKGGLVGALLLAFSLILLVRAFQTAPAPLPAYLGLTLGFMALAGLTQNWFEDSEVRFAFQLFLTQLAVCCRKAYA